MTIRQRYIAAGFITPLPNPLTLTELLDRGFFAAAKARLRKNKEQSKRAA